MDRTTSTSTSPSTATSTAPRSPRMPASVRRRAIAAAAIAVVAATALSACSSGASADTAGGPAPVKLVLGWYANSESGGYYAADTEGLYTDHKLAVSIQQGGPNVSGTTIVASGRADIGIADAPSIALAQQEGIPIVAVAALYQTNPVGVMVHADSGMTSFDDMQNHTWVVQTGNTAADYMAKEKGLTFTTQAYQGSIANFLADDSLVQQGWSTNEVYQAKKAGVDTTFFSYASAGYNPYNDVIFTSKKFLSEHPDTVKGFLAASMQGWSDYMGKTDVATSTNAALLKANSEQTSDSLWYAWDKQRTFLTDGDGGAQLGAMSSERWTTLVDQLTKLGVLTKKINPADLFDATLLPKVAAPTDLPAAPAGSY
ncbi:ABC transporter substrate-binding protein [Plantibacter sp. Mn2098]|uniref:ABC transporter substrate-binding protein n=1 Tax=Plantibacter sp. Mn2098 TaxID=3395266 RepID=UPI003BD44F51